MLLIFVLFSNLHLSREIVAPDKEGETAITFLLYDH